MQRLSPSRQAPYNDMDSPLNEQANGPLGGPAGNTEPEAAPTLATELAAPTVSRAYRCQCGRPVFLRNSECLACHTPLGYVIDRLGVMPLAPAVDGGALPDTFTVFGDPHGPTYRRCANLMTPAACSWSSCRRRGS